MMMWQQTYDIKIEIQKVKQHGKGYIKYPKCCSCKRYFKSGQPLYVVILWIGSSYMDITSICPKCWMTKDKFNVYLGKGDIDIEAKEGDDDGES